uniref:DUF834 domain-containing protein n=1 Tax=Oryza punctata TaxID=4537 RepID=A0A0E0MFI5_ORYPU
MLAGDIAVSWQRRKIGNRNTDPSIGVVDGGGDIGWQRCGAGAGERGPAPPGWAATTRRRFGRLEAARRDEVVVGDGNKVLMAGTVTPKRRRQLGAACREEAALVRGGGEEATSAGARTPDEVMLAEDGGEDAASATGGAGRGRWRRGGPGLGW